MKTQIKVMPDGFVWRVLTPTEARALWQTNTFEIFYLDSDGSEHLIESDDDFNDVVDDCTLAIECGYVTNINLKNENTEATLGDLTVRAKFVKDEEPKLLVCTDKSLLIVELAGRSVLTIKSTTNEQARL
jgi:hypothetical protein